MRFFSRACVQTDIENQKEDAGCLSDAFVSLWRWMIVKSKLSGKHNAPRSYTFMPDNLWLGVILLIPFTRQCSCLRIKSQQWELCQSTAVHQRNFHKWHLFPSFHPLDLWRGATTQRALSDVFEQLPSARPRWAVQISSDLFCMAPWY